MKFKLEKNPRISDNNKVEVTVFTSGAVIRVTDSGTDVFEAIDHQKDLQPLYTGGTIFHAFLPEPIDPDTCKKLVKKIAQTKLPYFSITPTFSICQNHGYIGGEAKECPECKEPTEVYSRVVGYLRPVATWNDGKKQEFKERTTYTHLG